jgi:hypothetical protein
METLQRTANRGSISTGYDIDNSLKIEADNAERMQRSYANITSAGTPTSTKIATISFWLKRTELQSSGDRLCFLADANYTWIGFANDGIYVLGSTAGINLRSSGKFRDTSAWYHIVVAFDTTQSTASNRVKVYVNGEQWTEFGVSENYGAQNNDIDLYDLNTSHYLGWSDAQSQSGYYSEFYLIDGQQLAPTEFGEFDEDSGIWKPKAYGGTFGVQGYHLDFEDSSALGADVSGNGNNFTNLYNITTANAAVDSPTNNFAILSHAMQGYYEDQWSVISEGGTKFRGTEFDAFITTVSSIGVTKGKWYAEFKITGARNNNMFGIASMEQLDNNSGYIYGGHLGKSGQTWGIGYYQETGNLYQQQNSGYTLISGWGSSISQLQTVGIAVDMDNHNLYLAVNNTYQNSGDPTSGATGTGAISFDDTETVAIATSGYSLGGGNDTIVEGNFGGYTATSISTPATDANGYGTFEYAPPSGYYALCTKNLAEYG